jgi:hypothetical protein
MPLILLFAFMQPPASPTTPEAALSAYRQAIEKGDPEAFANLTLGAAGTTLRSMAPALKKAQAASDAFTKALGEKPALNVTNPFADELNPLRGYQFELIELTKGKDEYLALVRFGLANRLQEETLSVKKEGEGYRVSAPSVYLKSIKELTPERLKKQIESLTALSGILTSLAEQVSKGQLTTKEAIVLKLAQAVKEMK